MSFLDDWKEWSKAKKAISIIVVCCIGLVIVGALVGGLSPDKNTMTADSEDAKEPTAPLQVRITCDGAWSGAISVGGTTTSSYDGEGSETIDLNGTASDILSVSIQKKTTSGELKVELLKNGKVVKEGSTSADYGVVTIAD